jgi:hypothetical protein
MIVAYLERLPARKAEWAFLLMDATTLPHLKKADAKKVTKRYERELKGHKLKEQATDNALKELNIGVRYDRKPG